MPINKLHWCNLVLYFSLLISIKMEVQQRNKKCSALSEIWIQYMWIIGDRADSGNGTSLSLVPLDVQPEQLRKLNEISDINMNEESGYNEMNEDVPEYVRLAKKFKLKELIETLHNTESTKDKMLELDSTLDMNVTIH